MTEPCGVVPEGRNCVRCDYDIRGLPCEGACPECGELIASSWREGELRFRDRTWVRTLQSGAYWLYNWVQCLMLQGLLSYLSIRHVFEVNVQHALAIVAVPLGAVGVWRITTRDPEEQDEYSREWARVTARRTMLAACCLIAGSSFAPSSSADFTLGYVVIRDVITGVGVCAICRYVQVLAQRTLDPQLNKRLTLYAAAFIVRIALSLMAVGVLAMELDDSHVLITTQAGLVQAMEPLMDLAFGLVALGMIGQLRRATQQRKRSQWIEW